MGATTAPPASLTGFLLVLLPACVFLFAVNGLYSAQRSRLIVSTFDEAGRGLSALLASGFALLLIGYLGQEDGMGQGPNVPAVVLFVLAGVATVPLLRSVTRALVLPTLAYPKRALIVGSGIVATAVYDKLTGHERFGVNVLGFADSDGNPVPGPVLGPASDVAAHLRATPDRPRHRRLSKRRTRGAPRPPCGPSGGRTSRSPSSHAHSRASPLARSWTISPDCRSSRCRRRVPASRRASPSGRSTSSSLAACWSSSPRSWPQSRSR